jgi:prepilin-type N-terminal cleavage/methylation domain-containing protein
MLSSSLMQRRAQTVRGCERRRAATRGFTLTELMAVVVISGILASLAIATLRQRAFASDVTSAKVVVRTIVAAEEHYRAENQIYLNVSTAGGAGWYPLIPAKNAKYAFFRTPPGSVADPESVKWRMLGPDIRQPVTFGFKANAGLPDTTPVLDNELAGTALPPPVEPWYLVQARADADGDGVGCMVAAASWIPEMFSVNDGE